MLGDQKIIGFIPTMDFERARAFYEGKLGLGYKSQDGFALVLDATGTMLWIAKVPDFKPAPFTIWIAPSGDKVAWFKDPDDNILSLSEHVKF